MFEKLQRLKEWIIKQVFWAEKELDGKSGAEKRAAVIKKLDEMITLPGYFEWLDDILIGKAVDTICGKLNTEYGHKFKDVELNAEQEQKLADEIEIKTPEGN